MTRVTVDFEWQPLGEINLSGTQSVFPRLPEGPGLFRFTFESPDHSAPGVYIGETDRLRRRAQHYRTPGQTQQTNVRMNKQLVDALRAGSRVSCAVVTEASISLDEAEPRQLDLARKTHRLLVENAALAAVVAERTADPDNGPLLINRPGIGEAEWT